MQMKQEPVEHRAFCSKSIYTTEEMLKNAHTFTRSHPEYKIEIEYCPKIPFDYKWLSDMTDGKPAWTFLIKNTKTGEQVIGWFGGDRIGIRGDYQENLPHIMFALCGVDVYEYRMNNFGGSMEELAEYFGDPESIASMDAGVGEKAWQAIGADYD